MKSKKKEIQFYYYKIRPKNFDELSDTDKQSSLNDLKKGLMPLSFKDAFANDGVLQGEYIIRLFPDTIYQNGYFTYGAFASIQLTNIPPKANVKDLSTEQLNLTDDEGLSYSTPFLYNKQHLIIMLPSLRPGPSVSSIKKFFEINFEIPSIDFIKISNPDELKKLQNSNQILELSFDLLLPETTNIDNNASVDAIIKEAQEFGAKEFNFKLKSTKKAPLDSVKVIKAVKNIFKRDKDQIKQLKVTAYNEQNIKDTFDFIAKYLKDKIIIDIQRNNRFSHSEIRQALMELYQKNSVILDNIT